MHATRISVRFLLLKYPALRISWGNTAGIHFDIHRAFQAVLLCNVPLVWALDGVEASKMARSSSLYIELERRVGWPVYGMLSRQCSSFKWNKVLHKAAESMLGETEILSMHNLFFG